MPKLISLLFIFGFTLVSLPKQTIAHTNSLKTNNCQLVLTSKGRGDSLMNLVNNLKVLRNIISQQGSSDPIKIEGVSLNDITAVISEYDFDSFTGITFESMDKKNLTSLKIDKELPIVTNHLVGSNPNEKQRVLDGIDHFITKYKHSSANESLVAGRKFVSESLHQGVADISNFYDEFGKHTGSLFLMDDPREDFSSTYVAWVWIHPDTSSPIRAATRNMIKKLILKHPGEGVAAFVGIENTRSQIFFNKLGLIPAWLHLKK